MGPLATLGEPGLQQSPEGRDAHCPQGECEHAPGQVSSQPVLESETAQECRDTNPPQGGSVAAALRYPHRGAVSLPCCGNTPGGVYLHTGYTSIPPKGGSVSAALQ